MSLYRSSTVQVVTPEGRTRKIPVERGLRQGDKLNSYLFRMVLDHVLTNALPADAEWGRLDDIALSSSSFTEAQATLQAVAASAREAGLAIDTDRTKVIVTGKLATEFADSTISLDGVHMKRLNLGHY